MCDSGQFLTGGCYSCTGGYTYPDELVSAGVVSPTANACYIVTTDVVDCDLIVDADLPPVPRTFNEYFELNPYVTAYVDTQNANVASFPANSNVGYGYVHDAYTAMGKGSVFSSSATLRNSADGILDTQFKKEHAAPYYPNGSFTSGANNCDWGYLHMTDAVGGITDSASRVTTFIDALWDAMQSGHSVADAQSPVAVWRTTGLNYGVFVDGKPVDCVYGKGCLNSELRFAEAGASGSVTTVDAAPEAGDMVDTTVTTPNAWFVSVFEQSFRSDGADLNVKVYAPTASAAVPMSVEFLIRLTASGQTVQIYKDSALVLACADSSGTASPNPCVSGAVQDTDGLHLTVLASTDGTYSFEDGTGALLLDSDGDGVLNTYDNCTAVNNQDQTDTDGDGTGNAGESDVCNPDDDNDGMPDDWELTYGLDQFLDDASDDEDGDGVLNVKECQLGLHPLEPDNPLASPRLVFPSNGAVVTGMPVNLVWKKITSPDGAPLPYDIFVCEGDRDFSGPCATPLNTVSVAATSGGKGNGENKWAGAEMLFVGIVLAGGITGRRRLALLVLALVLAGSMLASCGSHKELNKYSNFYQVNGLNPGSTYYWKMTVSDIEKDITAESVTWSFTVE